MLATLNEVMEIAEQKKIAIGSFNTPNLESLRAVTEAAEELDLPVIIQFAQCHESLIPLQMIGSMMVEAAKNAAVPVCVHLDHGETLEYLQQALDIGFTSVMFDGSALPMEENAAKTLEVVRLATNYHAAVEAEIGHLGRTETGEKTEEAYTNPTDAICFAEETGVDALAVAIGNAHGVYAGTPVFHFEVLETIREKCATPLVLHGGTGSSEKNFRRCIQSGVRKINIATAIFQASAKAAKSVTSNDWFAMSGKMTDAVTDVVKEHISIFGKARGC